jgi:phage terminase large subunit-like protein
LWTPPLRELTPETSYGYDVIEFAQDVLGEPLDPWQEWTVIHAGELLPDGRPRFRKILILVARQNGKTHLLVVLSLYWMFVDQVDMILGTSTKLDYAAESWRKACKLAKRVPDLYAEIAHKGAVRKANGEQVLWRADEDELELDEGSRYKIAASNEEGGRSLTIDRLVLDELRHHYDYSAHDASVPATNAVPDAQIVGISNAGSIKSEVLNDWRKAALDYIKTGKGDPRLGLIEYSTPEDANPLDIRALAQANPNLGRRIDPDALLGDAKTAVETGGKKLAGFKTEIMCINVQQLDPAVDPEKWADCLDIGDLSEVRDRVVLCVDVSTDGQHATLVAAAMLPDGRVRIDVKKAWSGPKATAELRAELPDEVAEVKPKKLGWFPSGPAAAVAAELSAERDEDDPRSMWPPAGVEVEEIRSVAASAVCMGFAEQVNSKEIAHSDDPLMNAHVEAAEKLHSGNVWRFVRKGTGHVDAAYAGAGAVHLARTLPFEKPPPKSQVF